METSMIKAGYLKIIIILALTLFPGTGPAEAGTGDAGQGGEFFRYGVGARAMAMGGAYTSLADDATAVFWNPAGLSQIESPSFQFMQTELYLDSRLLYGALAFPYYGFPDKGSKLAFGLGMLGLKTEGFIPYSSDDRFLGGSFDDSQFAVSASAAYDRVSHLGRMAAGVNLIAFNHELYGYGDWGAGADFGVLAQLINPPRFSLLGLIPIRHLIPWRFGAVYHTATGEELLRADQDYPDYLRIGLSNSDIRIPGVPGSITASYQFGRVLSEWRDDGHRVGAEYRIPLYRDFIFSLRGGVDLSADSGEEGGYSWGFGLRGGDISLLGWNGAIGVDFAQKPHQMLSSANFISLRLIFGPSAPENEEGRALPDREMIRRFLEYPRDPVLSHPDSAAVAEARRGYYDIGRELRDSHAAGTRNHTRYDEFILGITGWLYRIRTAVDDYRDLVIENRSPAGGSGSLSSSLRQWRNEFGKFLDDCSGRLDKLARPNNIEALRYYITDLMLAGREDEVREVISDGGLASRNSSFTGWDRSYFMALSDADETGELRKAIEGKNYRTADPRYLKVYLKFLLAVRERNVQLLKRVASMEEAEAFALSYYPVTPFMPDGILADDAILLKNCIELREMGEPGAEEIRESLSDPIDRYTGGSAFSILSAHISNAVTTEDFRNAAEEIIRFYTVNSESDGIFWPR
jgi:hypothetical protein